MKFAVVLVVLSAAVMVVMIFQAVRQELQLRNLKARMSENSAEVKRKEESVVELKGKIGQMKSQLESVGTKIDHLKKEMATSEASVQENNQSLQTCNKEKAETEKKKSEIGEATAKLKAAHDVAKQKAEGDIQSLKQQILDRDRALCAFADTTKEEARKLCGIFEAPK